MPPKNQKSTAGKGRATEEAKEDPLSAVVIADGFENRFRPFTVEKPRCLLPLANTPLIEYTLEYLASAGVEIVYIYAGPHVDQLEAYINASRWRRSTSPFAELVFLRCIATCVGDVMRDLDQKHLMSGDFLVVGGDIVSNFPLEKALSQHKSRREKDKNAIMTMVLRESEPSVHEYSDGVVSTFVLDPTKNRCLHYEESPPGTQFTAQIDPEILKTPELEVRQDLFDCRIDICTPDVLSLWSDNFDNQSPRKDFLFGVLKDWELNGKTIHTFIVKDHYASRVADFWSYNTISQDFQKDIVSSIAVENNVFGDTHYNRSQSGYTKDHAVIVHRPAKIDGGSIVGPDTSLGRGCSLQSSVVGQRCHVGKDTQLHSTYVWDDVTIGNNVKITRSIVGNEVFIGDDCVINEGALISFGVRIAPGTIVPAGSRVCRGQRGPDGEARNDGLVGGEAGDGHAYLEQEDDYFGSSGSRLVFNKLDYAESVSSLGSDISEGEVSSFEGSRSHSFATSMSDDDHGDRFQHDTVAILFQRMKEGQKADDMLSELMGLRFSGGADETQVRHAVAVALMKHIHGCIEENLAPAEATRKTLQAYNTLIRRKGAVQAVHEQVLFLLDAQRDLTRRKEGGKTLLFVVKDLYDLEVFGEEAFVAWWADERSSSDTEMSSVREQSAQFIEWLENAESESESGEDDDDDDDDDDEDE